MTYPEARARRGDSQDADLHSGDAAARKWLREHEKRDSAPKPVQRRPNPIEAVERKDQTPCAKTPLVAVLERVPFTAPWRERKRLERERMDSIGHLRKFQAAEATASCEAVCPDRPVRGENRHDAPLHARLREIPASGDLLVMGEAATKPRGRESSKLPRDRVA